MTPLAANFEQITGVFLPENPFLPQAFSTCAFFMRYLFPLYLQIVLDF